MVQILLCLAIVAFVAAITSRMRKRQQEMEKVEIENRKKVKPYRCWQNNYRLR